MLKLGKHGENDLLTLFQLVPQFSLLRLHPQQLVLQTVRLASSALVLPEPRCLLLELGAQLLQLCV